MKNSPSTYFQTYKKSESQKAKYTFGLCSKFEMKKFNIFVTLLSHCQKGYG